MVGKGSERLDGRLRQGPGKLCQGLGEAQFQPNAGFCYPHHFNFYERPSYKHQPRNRLAFKKALSNSFNFGSFVHRLYLMAAGSRR